MNGIGDLIRVAGVINSQGDTPSPQSLAHFLVQANHLEQDLERKAVRVVDEDLSKIRSAVRKVLDCSPRCEPHALLLASDSRFQIPAPLREWYLNLGLLRQAERCATSDQTRGLITFLVANHLAKASPVYPEEMSLKESEKKQLLESSQLSLLRPGYLYNRGAKAFDSLLVSILRENVPFGKKSPVVQLIDTKEIAPLFPIWFTVLSYNHLQQQIAELVRNQTDFSCYLPHPLLLDVPQADSYDEIRKKVDADIEMICRGHPTPQTFAAYIRSQITCITRVEYQGVGAVMLIPLWDKPESFMCSPGTTSLLGVSKGSTENLAQVLLQNFYERASVNLDEFLSISGARLGCVHGREALSRMLTLEELITKLGGQPVDFREVGANTFFYKNRTDILQTRSFRLFQGISSVSARAFAQVLEGLLNQISDDAWQSKHQDPSIKMIIQTYLFQLQTTLASAHQHQHDFKRLSREVEKAHYILAALLTIFSPYRSSDLREIFQSELANLPNSLRRFATIGLTKSGMNTFSGVVSATSQSKQDPKIAYMPECYRELREYLKTGHDIETAIRNKLPVDLFIADFNHNIVLDPNIERYLKGDVFGQLKTLLAQDNPITVAIDLTIDAIDSTHVTQLFAEFEKDILSGKLNIILFRSGQKFDMFGIDNYYGSPFVMINNHSPQWQKFEMLASSPAFQADPLSYQWFCLAYQHARKELKEYQQLFFQHTKKVLDAIPDKLKDGSHPHFHVCSVDPQMQSCFIQVRAKGEHQQMKIQELDQHLLSFLVERGLTAYSRAGFGFPETVTTQYMKGYHQATNTASLRINPGLNPADVEALILFFNRLVQQPA